MWFSIRSFVDSVRKQLARMPAKRRNGSYRMGMETLEPREVMSVNAIPVGSFGLSSTGNLWGYAIDPTTPAVPTKVAMYVDGSLFASYETDVARADVNSLFGASGNHGFSYFVPGQFYDGNPHRVDVYAIDTTDASVRTLLGGSGSVFQFTDANRPPFGYFDLGPTGNLWGYSVDPTARGVSNLVEIWVDGQPVNTINTINTDVLRPDVNSGYSATGNHGFSYFLPRQFYDGNPHRVDVYGLDTEDTSRRALLAGSSAVFADRMPFGHFDLGPNGNLWGYAVAPTTPGVSALVEILVDGQAVNTINTDILRTDVNSLYSATGNHGFSYFLPKRFFDGNPHRVEVLGLDTTNTDRRVAISGSGVTFQQFLPPAIEIDGLTDGQTTPLEFGSVHQGTTTPTRFFIVRNTGEGPLTFGSISLPSGFSVTDGLPASLAPGQSDVLTIQLNTTTAGSFGGTVTIANNDVHKHPFDFVISGVVRGAEIGVDGVTDAQATPVDFGSPLQGTTAPTRTFTVRNTGNETLTLGGVITPAGYTITDSLATSLAPGQFDTFTIRLNTTAAGTFSGQVRFTTNDSDESPFNFPITGTIIPLTPEISVDGVVDGQSTAADFGSHSVGTTAPTRTFTVRNTGTGTLTLGTISLPSGFTVTEGLTSSLAPGQSDSFTVRLNTSAAGTFSGQISFITNDADETPFNFPVTGTVTTPEIAVDGISDGQTTAIDFGTTVRGAMPVTRTYTVQNLGSGPLTLGAITVPAGYVVSENRLPPSLAAGGSATFSVRLQTTTSGTFSGQISIANNDADEGPFNFPVTGRVDAAPTSARGTVVGWSITTNGNGQTLLLKSVRVSGPASNQIRLFGDLISSSGGSIRSDVAIGNHSRFGNQSTPSAIAMQNGNFVIAWVLNGSSRADIRYAIMTPFGQSVGAVDGAANTSFSSRSTLTNLVSTNAGFDITWVTNSNNRTLARRFNFVGVPLSGETRLG